MARLIRYTIVFLFGSILFLPFLGQVHLFDWDEINFAESAREMMATGDYLRVRINYEPFWEKPPLFIWLQVLSMQWLGVNEYAARLPNALTGILTLMILFYVGKRVVNRRMAGWWVLLYAATWLPHFYFKSGIIDPLFNLFIFLAFFQVFLLKDSKRPSLHSGLAGLFLGLAVLTKGPVALLIALISFFVYLVVNKGIWGYQWKHFLFLGLCAALTTSLWFGLEVINNGWWFIKEFLVYQVRLLRTEDAGHGGPFFYHFLVLLLGCFPASAFLFQFSRSPYSRQDATFEFSRWMVILLGVVLVLFSIVKTKIVHYSSLAYFPLSFLAAVQIYRITRRRAPVRSWVTGLILGIGSLLGIALAALPWMGAHQERWIHWVQDPFAVANLQAEVNWSSWESFWGIGFVAMVWISAWMMRTQAKKGIILLMVSSLITLQVAILHFTPKVEAYTQRAAIEFFKQVSQEDAYIHALGYKSYAPLFYGRKPPGQRPESREEEWLLRGPIDKPVYFICKLPDKPKYDAMSALQQLGEENGFVFYRRDPEPRGQ